MIYIIGNEKYPHPWHIKLNIQDSQSLLHSIPHYFLVVSKNKQQQMIHLSKENLVLKNWMWWDFLLLRNVSRYTFKKPCVYEIVDNGIPPRCTRSETGTTDKTWCVIFIRLGFFLSCFIRGWTLPLSVLCFLQVNLL